MLYTAFKAALQYRPKNQHMCFVSCLCLNTRSILMHHNFDSGVVWISISLAFSLHSQGVNWHPGWSQLSAFATRNPPSLRSPLHSRSSHPIFRGQRIHWKTAHGNNNGRIMTKNPAMIIWLVVSTHLKNISQNGKLPQVGIFFFPDFSAIGRACGAFLHLIRHLVSHWRVGW